ncbi:acyl-coenzyme A oxidase, partial [Elysia marginata]
MAAPVFNIDADALPMNPDLQKERASASFNVKELTHILDGGPEITKRRKELEQLILSDPAFSSRDLLYLDKSGQYDNAVHRSVKLVHWKDKYKWSEQDMELATLNINNSTEAVTVHRDMFIPALQRLTSEEQRAKWLPLALNHKIIGTYAQTELGHGTNLRNLETTATFDPQTDEFVMNTPKITSMKWWPGGLGKSSTHAIVLAQLVIAGKNCGLQPFMVQLRSLDDHTPMPGISVGDIGPKLTLNYVDNGFLIMKNVRIPRENMLMGNAHVSRDGKFKQLKSDKSNYSTMMYVRVLITRWACGTLASAVMIATRYSAVRRQLYIDPQGGEVQIIDYQTQQYKLFPAMASMFGIFFTSQKLVSAYNRELPRLIKGDKGLLAE